MNVNYPPGTILYGYALDCKAEGCLEKLGYVHDDDGEVRQLDPRWEYPRPGYRINRHAVRAVKRVVPEWEPVTDEEVLTAMREGQVRVKALSKEE